MNFTEKILNFLSFLILESFVDPSVYDAFLVVWAGAGCPSLMTAGAGLAQASSYLTDAAISTENKTAILNFFTRISQDLHDLGSGDPSVDDVNAFLASVLAARSPHSVDEWKKIIKDKPEVAATLRKQLEKMAKYADRVQGVPTGTAGVHSAVLHKTVSPNEGYETALKGLTEFVPPADADRTPVLTPSGISVKDPFDAVEIADLVLQHGKAKAMEAILQRKEILRIAEALSTGKAATEIPKRQITLQKPAKALPYFVNEIWYQLNAIWDVSAPEHEIVFDEEIITSSIHHTVTETVYTVLSEQYREVSANIATVREELAKNKTVPLEIRLGLLENTQQEIIKMMNAKSNRKTFPLGADEFRLPATTIKVHVKPENMATAKGLLRQWRLSTDIAFDIKSQAIKVDVNSYVNQNVFDVMQATVRTKAVDLAMSVLDMGTVTASSLNDLMAKSKQVFPSVTVKNPLVFTEWPTELQTIIQSAKTASKGVAKAIAYCVDKIKGLTATKFDKSFVQAVLKCPATSMSAILTKYGSKSESELPPRVKLAVIWCSKQSKPEAEFARLQDGTLPLDQFEEAEKELLKQELKSVPKITLNSLMGSNQKDKKKAKKEALKGAFDDAMTVAWIEQYEQLAQPTWVAKAAVINYDVVLKMIQNKLCGSGTSGLSNNKDFKTYKWTTLQKFATDFYGWREGGDFFASDENKKYSCTQIREGAALSVWNAIKNLQEVVKDSATGLETRRPVLVWDITDLKNRVSRIPAERKSESGPAKGKKKSKKSKKSGQKNDSPSAPTTTTPAKPRGRSATPAPSGDRRGRSRSRSNRNTNASGRPAGNASKSRSQSRKPDNSGKKNDSWTEVVKKSRKPQEAKRGRSPSAPRAGAKNAPGNSTNGRTVQLDGKSYKVGDLIASLPADRKSTVTLGNNQFTGAFLERLLANRAVKTISSALDAKGKVKPGYSWDPAQKKFVRKSSSAPPSGRNSPTELKVQPTGNSSGKGRSASQTRSK